MAKKNHQQETLKTQYDQATVGGTNGATEGHEGKGHEGDESNEPTPVAAPAAPVVPTVRKPGRQPGQVSRPPFPWGVQREEILITTIYAHSDGNACSLTSEALYDLLKVNDAFTSSPVTLTLENVRNHYKKVAERMTKAGDSFPVLASSPRARQASLSAESIQRLRDAIRGTRQPETETVPE